jgi:hypothetical protein
MPSESLLTRLHGPNQTRSKAWTRAHEAATVGHDRLSCPQIQALLRFLFNV